MGLQFRGGPAASLAPTVRQLAPQLERHVWPGLVPAALDAPVINTQGQDLTACVLGRSAAPAMPTTGTRRSPRSRRVPHPLKGDE